jgi:hypothetical protein
MEEPVSLDVIAERNRGATEERERLVHEQALEADKLGAQDRAFRALVLFVVFVVTSMTAVGLPLLALLAGVSMRLFRWAAGW